LAIDEVDSILNETADFIYDKGEFFENRNKNLTSAKKQKTRIRF